MVEAGSGDIEKAARLLRAGRLVAFPTETVYGLGADASSAEAIARLYAVKGRPGEHPVIVHVADAATAFEWASEVPEAARMLAEEFWPGPLTLILKKAPHVGGFVTGGQDSVGLRVPGHPLAHELLEEFGLTHIARNRAYSLSGGERRRVEIARSLAIDPKFILLDEPFAGIDPIAVFDIQRIVSQLRSRGIGILITDHNVRETLKITDRAYIIKEGEIFRQGAPEELSADAEVRRIYLGESFNLG